MFNRYYQEELAYLREIGREFSQVMPDAARFLGETGSDPDVERLLEGFAFLTARVRQKLDDELPELTHSVLEMIAPHYLRPIPSATIMQFTPSAAALKEAKVVPRGSLLDSEPVDGTRCRFRTAFDTPLTPLTLDSLDVRRESPRYIRIRFTVPRACDLATFGLDEMRLHLTGDSAATRGLYLALCRYRTAIHARTWTADERPDDKEFVRTSGVKIEPVGFRDDESLLAYPAASFDGFRVLQEYFAFPQKFMFFDMKGLTNIPLPEKVAGIEFQIDTARIPEDLPPVSVSNLALNCSPAINLFEHNADPVTLDYKRREYLVKPSGKPSHYEVHSVDESWGVVRGRGARRSFRPLFRIELADPRQGPFFVTRRREALSIDGSEVYISFIGAEGSTEDTRVARGTEEIVSFDLTCSNRTLPSQLGVGDITKPTDNSPTFATFRNITRPTATVPPPLEGDDYWRLIAHLALHQRSLVDIGVLRGALTLYDYPARVDRQQEREHKLLLEGLHEIESRPAMRLLDGSPLRGQQVDLTLNEEQFGSEGELYLFGSVLNEVLSRGVALNSFIQLRTLGLKTGEEHTWRAKIGETSLV